MMEAAEEEISARQGMVVRSETPLAPRLQEESRARWKKRNACERGWRAGEIWNREKVETAREGPKDL